ncbi:hypothetical protein A1Q1_01729 [Trichosporon asahii var. asahii CBS 2479]|uniref:CCAAT-binding factor domain-containing protein n=1 Tax=Trichosporon asahii var. asahii (strain ATCC 90039 / CBS 2479 / JCM 2466 / KCTC 7840 / NBRC 103889/ NCYC 2677 / UAMH 7654) TaxID=1186058 RepID=J4UDA4_TRIAS|nr:hypothetical protein A1Q1_01729 [Trichosporon asahii var. asahii CBS 2479]EJT49080.1 hypothetical protein A1Q1_01729 [Trichosporon asahii var. asahii CBS 2479]
MAPSPLLQVQKLEEALTAKPADPNPILALLALARHANPEVVHKAVWALYRVFGVQLAQGRVGGITGPKERESAEVKDGGKVKSWLRDRLLEYAAILGGLLHDSEAALRLLFALLVPLSESAGVPIHLPYFRILVSYLLAPPDSQRGASSHDSTLEENQEGPSGELPLDVAGAAVDDYWAKYDDLRLFFFREIPSFLPLQHVDNLLNQLVHLIYLPKEQGDINAFFIPGLKANPSSAKKAKSKKGKKGKKEVDALPDWMEAYDEPSDEEEEQLAGKKRQRTAALGTAAAVHSLAAHTAAYTAAWEGVLSYPLEKGWERRVLTNLHGERGILAYMSASRRVIVADWLGATVDRGGAHAMLAMNGLYVLMTAYNLDYPNFYTRLYALLTPEVLHARYRARFFRLLEFYQEARAFGADGPAGRRRARHPLHVQPLQEASGTMPMLHRLDDGQDLDPYDATEPNPLSTKAIDGSVWELGAVRKHYLASIAVMAQVFEEQFTKPPFLLEDFLDHGYQTLFNTEAERKIKNPPALSVQLELGKPEDMPAPFPSGDGGFGEDKDVVSELWAF